jgi:hypothetical protein
MSTETEQTRDLDQEKKRIEVTIDDCKEAIAFMDDLKRLRNSPAWQRLIENHYLNEYALGRVMLKADPSQRGPQEQMDIENKLQAVAHFNIFLHYVDIEGMNAERLLKEADVALDEIDQEIADRP